jgi:hypothetical protein
MNRALVLSTLAAVVLSALAACGPAQAPVTPLKGIAVCEGRNRSNLLGLGRVYNAASLNSCKEAILPFDLGAWIEAPLNSHKAKGLRSVILGCANLTGNAADCDYGGPQGHSVTVQMSFDLSLYPDLARVQKAALAVHIGNNGGFFTQTAQLRGRFLTGDVLQSLGDPRQVPSTMPGWVLFDITEFAARAVNERRNSVQFEISLPCGRSEAELTNFSLLANEPRVIVEFF